MEFYSPKEELSLQFNKGRFLVIPKANEEGFWGRLDVLPYDKSQHQWDKLDKDEFGNPAILNFTNGNQQYLVEYPSGFFHFVVDFIPTMMRAREPGKNQGDLVIYLPRFENPYQDEARSFIFNWMSRHKVNHRVLNSYNFKGAIMSNIIYKPSFLMTSDNIDYLTEFKNMTIENPEAKPWRKVFVSRKKQRLKTPEACVGPVKDKSKLMFHDDVRMDDELKLEEYFKSKGFEIFVAEDFVDFKAQMQYFHETKTIVGVTGAALINSAFMQKSGKLIELQVPLTVGGIEMIHIDYHGLSFKMDHQYLTISSNRKADTVLEKIQNNKALESLICE